MAEKTSIEWTKHTFNPWWGCTKISPACKYCYAETWAKRTGHMIWGPGVERRQLSEHHWRQPLKWARAAAAVGEQAQVFCASMADVFEDNAGLDPLRERLWNLIAATPELDWQLLTKRPESIMSMVPWGRQWPKNVWLGTTVESQAYAQERLPHLCSIPAAVRFISAEPLLGPLDIGAWASQLDWVITGGESGAGARPFRPAWFRELRDDCVDAGIAFHFKQWGDWAPAASGLKSASSQIMGDGTVMARIGKRVAGRELDGRTWDELPVTRPLRQR